jgi:Amt family ammonium transporter
MVCYLAVTKLKARFHYDDSLDVFGVHGVGSMTGLLMLGFLANPEINPAIASTFQINGVVQSLAGGTSQFLNQAMGGIFTAIFAGVSTFIIYRIVDALVGMRVDQEEEYTGLDITQHGESAYGE